MIPPLTAEQQELVEANMRLVGWVLTHRLNRRHGDHDWDDAYQDASLGLMHAARKYDPELGHKFSTYAVRCIWGYVLKGHNRRKGRSVETVSLDFEIRVDNDGGQVALNDMVADPARPFDDRLVDVDELRRALNHLHAHPEELAAILAGTEGGGHAALAAAEGITRQGVIVRAQRGRRRIKRLMPNRGADTE